MILEPFKWRRLGDQLEACFDNPPPGWRIGRTVVPNGWYAEWLATGGNWVVITGAGYRGEDPPEQRIECIHGDGGAPPALDELEAALTATLGDSLPPAPERAAGPSPNAPGTAIALRTRLEEIERRARNRTEDDDLTREVQAALGDMEQLAERCAEALAECGVTDDGQHSHSALLFELRRAARR